MSDPSHHDTHRPPATESTATIPPFASLHVGDVTVTALYDGTVTVDLRANLTGIAPDDLDALLFRAFRNDPLVLSINAFVVDTGSERVIVDTGAGALMGPTAGRLPSSLAAAGLVPDDIDRVLLTHLNGDHMGGLVVDGDPFFPRADVCIVVGQADTDLWLDPSKRGDVAENLKPTFDQAEQMIAPYRDAGRLQPVGPGAEVAAGVTVVGTPGHTPGHVGFMVESQGQRMHLWGDIVHVAPVQFSRPDVAIDFDHDSPQAIRTRRSVLEEAATEGYLVAGAHLPFPGFGNVGRSDDGFEYVPVELVPVTTPESTR